MNSYLTRLKEGSLKLYALDALVSPKEAVTIRRRYIEEETGVQMPHTGMVSIPLEDVVRKNCENMIGAVQVPLGVAGPVLMHGEYAKGSFFLPLATTEGALVASVNRGCSAISKAGGADVRIFADCMTRAPVFATRSVIHAREMVDWIADHKNEIADAAQQTTRHGKVTDIETYHAGTSVYVRLCFSTGDAMGMNMVTIASEKAAEVISLKTGARLISLSGNVCTDKKPAAINMILGRGRSVSAGVSLSEQQVMDIFKTDSKAMIEVSIRKNLVGSARAGSLGFNAHAANIIAAMFIACGQDPAHVVEGSLCITTIDPTDDGIYASVTLPALPVGTVGGGTRLGTQAECLSMLGVAGGGDPPGSHAKKLAEIVATGVLAGELSLIGAQAAQHLARAHQELGR
ncbi:MAG: hydroxymethylglutaryl-CoA reductase (NADPH) [Methanospirillaceae archaeon]|nr:hydroxymethylglutaryl-CoA reductase (NADPH) [Methanospirillaceae archaeon]